MLLDRMKSSTLGGSSGFTISGSRARLKKGIQLTAPWGLKAKVRAGEGVAALGTAQNLMVNLVFLRSLGGGLLTINNTFINVRLEEAHRWLKLRGRTFRGQSS